MRKLLILFVLLPILSYGQLYEQDKEFFFLSSGVDVANLADLGDDINGYNGTFDFGYRNGDVQIQLTYETFPNRQFQSYGAGVSYVMNSEYRLNTVVGGTLSLIWRDVYLHERHHDPSAAIHIQFEYHWNGVFLFLKNEGRYRGDIKAMYGKDENLFVYSLYTGIGFKF